MFPLPRTSSDSQPDSPLFLQPNSLSTETGLYRCSAMNLNNSVIPAAAAGATGALNITVVRGHQLAKNESRKCYVVVTVDEKKEKTKDTGEWDWNETFRFDVHGSSNLTIQVYGKHPLKSVKLIGTFEGSFVDLFESAPTGDFDVALVPHSPKVELRPRISLRVQLDPDQMVVAMAAAVQRATFAAHRMREPRATGSLSPAIDSSDLSSAASAIQVWEPLLQKLRMFDHLAGTVAGVHPYAKAAYFVIAAAYKIAQTQIERDANILCLADIMDDTYSFIQEAEPLRRIESQKQIMTSIAQQTVECGHFITTYCKDSFGVRMMKHLGADTDTLILQFGAKFTELKEALKSRAIIQTEILVFRVLENLQNIATEIDLQAMPYAHGARFQSSKACFPGTRTEILDDLSEWINSPNPDRARICILYGDKGSGKSAIAHSVSHSFYEAHRLGSSFFFDSVDLDLDAHYRTALSDVISHNQALRTTYDIRDQFDNFLIKPTRKLSGMIGPIVLVFDGWDTNCSLEVQQTLLSELSIRAKELPANFCIILTTRVRASMLKYFQHMDVICKSVDHWTNHDLLHYVFGRLSIHGQLFNGVEDRKCCMLVDMSDNNFLWILEACNGIQGGCSEVEDLGPSQKLENLLQQAYGLVQLPDQQNSFYLNQLSSVVDSSDAIVMKKFKTVMAFMLTAKTPLSKCSLQKILEHSTVSMAISQDDVSHIIQSMSSLFSGTTYSGVPIQPLYKSLYTFLGDQSCSQEFWVDETSYDYIFASACLDVLNTELQFNILHLRTSHMYNKDIPALSNCVWEFISPHLQYACKFLVDHLNKSAFSIDLLPYVQNFLYNGFLFWLETLSLIDVVEIAVPTLNAIAHWVRGHNTDATTFVEDAQTFLQMFQSHIVESVSAKYLALLLLPGTSHISKHYTHTFIYNGDIIDESQSELMYNNYLANWAVNLKATTKQITYSSMDHILHVWESEVHDGRVLEGHTEMVVSVAFSPDGKWIASGSLDRRIHIWNTDTGKIVLQLTGHTEMVMSVAFSPDGKKIVSGSLDKTICIWNTETGKMMLQLEEHAEPVCSVAFSHDGKQIASGYADNTICIWNTEIGKLVMQLKEHANTVCSVAFSPDDKKIVSGSADKTLCIWDTETGKLVLQLKGHTEGILSVAFSPDGKHIVSGSADKTLCIWDTETGKIMLQLKGHTEGVVSVSFSPDGEQILSGSVDKTICIWNTETGKMVLQLKGHTEMVMSAAFSPDGKQIVSGSADKTICIWNADLETVLPLQGDIVLLPLSSNTSVQTKSSSNALATTFKIELWSGDYHGIRASQNDTVWLPICGMLHLGARPTTNM